MAIDNTNERTRMDTMNPDDDSINLLDLAATLWKYRKMIIGVTAAGMLCAVLVSIASLLLPPALSFLPNEYSPRSLMLINDNNSKGGLASMLNSSLGSLAGLAGVNFSAGAGYSDLAVYLAGTNDFLDAVVDKFDLVSRYRIKKFLRTESRKALRKNLSASYDEDSGVYSISFTDYDPAFAQQVVNFATSWMEARFTALGLDSNQRQKDNLEKNIENTWQEVLRLEAESKRLERSVSMGQAAGDIPSITTEYARLQRELAAQEEIYKQLKIQYELVKVTMASESPIFQVIEYAEVPDKKSGPSRGMLCVVVSFAAAFLSVLAAFLRDAIARIRGDSEAMSKLTGKA